MLDAMYDAADEACELLSLAYDRARSDFARTNIDLQLAKWERKRYDAEVARIALRAKATLIEPPSEKDVEKVAALLKKLERHTARRGNVDQGVKIATSVFSRGKDLLPEVFDALPQAPSLRDR